MRVLRLPQNETEVRRKGRSLAPTRITANLVNAYEIITAFELCKYVSPEFMPQDPLFLRFEGTLETILFSLSVKFNIYRYILH
jgi:hypothetical protein